VPARPLFGIGNPENPGLTISYELMPTVSGGGRRTVSTFQRTGRWLVAESETFRVGDVFKTEADAQLAHDRMQDIPLYRDYGTGVHPYYGYFFGEPPENPEIKGHCLHLKDGARRYSRSLEDVSNACRDFRVGLDKGRETFDFASLQVGDEVSGMRVVKVQKNGKILLEPV